MWPAPVYPLDSVRLLLCRARNTFVPVRSLADGSLYLSLSPSINNGHSLSMNAG